MLEAGDGPLFP